MIYADNAATTPLDARVFEAMKPFLLNEYANASQPYSFSRTVRKALWNARETIANCINASPEEIVFTSGGTESDNQAIKSVGTSGGAIIASAIEHHAVLNSCKAIERLGCRVRLIKPNFDGKIDRNDLKDMLTNETRLVSIMTVNNEIGTVQPIGELCAIAHAEGALFHTDAVQAVGHMPIDVKALGIDLLSASAHKFNGPKGVGFLFVRNGVQLSPLIDGGSQEFDRRAGTENVAAIVGMAEALRLNCDRMEENCRHIRELEDAFLDRLEISYVRNGGRRTLPGLISLSFEGKSGEAILHRMDLMGICISTGSACDGQRDQVSHVLKAIRLNESAARGTIRISFGKQNTLEDAARLADALTKIVSD